jgi:hypothetical protein
MKTRESCEVGSVRPEALASPHYLVTPPGCVEANLYVELLEGTSCMRISTVSLPMAGNGTNGTERKSSAKRRSQSRGFLNLGAMPPMATAGTNSVSIVPRLIGPFVPTCRTTLRYHRYSKPIRRSKLHWSRAGCTALPVVRNRAFDSSSEQNVKAILLWISLRC